MITHLSVILTGYDIGIHAKTTSIKRDSYNNQVNTYHIEIGLKYRNKMIVISCIDIIPFLLTCEDHFE